MSKTMTLTAELRDALGTKRSKALRQQGHLPVVLYGHGEANANLLINNKEFTRAFEGGSRLFELNLGKSKETAMLVDVQWDAFGDNVIHADFNRINLDEAVVVHVPLEFKGTPAGLKAGGLIEKQHIHLSIECKAATIPAQITVDISALEIGDSLRVKDITIPENATVQDAEDLVILHIAAPQDEAVAEAGEEEEEKPTSPEVITEKKEDTDSKD